MKKVSIIIPVYNSEKYISKCLDSVLNQTYKNIEILVINDGSKDNSIDILREYEKKDDRIVVIDKENEGVAKTRNQGIKKATGDYIMFIDNDDFIDEDYVETYLKNTDYDIVIGSYKRTDVNDKILFKYNLDEKSIWSKYVVLAPWAKLYKKDFLIKNNIEFLNYGIGEDVYFNLLCYSKTNNIKVINDFKYNWFYNNESVSNTKQRGLKKTVDITVLLNNLLTFVDLNSEYNKYFLERYIYWYLLFSGKQASKGDFTEQYNNYIKWLNDNKIKSNIKPLFLKGEPFKIKMVVIIFRMIRKLHLIKLFSKVYCKGE
ncbi:MAG: glycosyltransferase family 2 protein [Bacilli bacterium]|nr:glycosyltransferase family 2 protein [Bacilli bacterium]